MKLVWVAFGLVLVGVVPCAASAESVRQSLDDAWWTGPLLAPTAGTLPVGHILFEPYFYDSVPTASVDAAGHAHPVPRENNFGSQSYFLYGLADRFTVGLIPRFGFKEADSGRGSSSINAGDLSLQAQYQLTQFEEGHWLPTISVNLGETLPVGAYDRLDRFSNGFGAGAYTTTLSLYSQTYFWMPGGRLLRTRLNLSHALSQSVDLMDRSVYGTTPDFRGHASPGGSGVADLAFEYSIDRNWVAAMDLWLEQDENTRVTGSYPGVPQMVSNLGRARVFYVAPALEYNFSSTFGIILGARVFAAGENQTASVTPVIAFNYVH
jgi:hypothetical protein